MARTDPQVNFRIPAELNERLKEAAAQNGRTITAELVHRLEASFRRNIDDDQFLAAAAALEQDGANAKMRAALTSHVLMRWLDLGLENVVDALPDGALETVRNAAEDTVDAYSAVPWGEVTIGDMLRAAPKVPAATKAVEKPRRKR